MPSQRSGLISPARTAFMASYDLHLNLLAINGKFPLFSVFRRERVEGEEADPDTGITSAKS